MSANLKLISGWRTRFIRIKVIWFILTEAYKCYGDPFQAISILRKLRTLRQKVHGCKVIKKYIKSGRQYFWNSDYCGYPSENFKALLHGEFLRNRQIDIDDSGEIPPLQTIIWGITNRCPLVCNHCYEWDNIAQSDALDLTALKRIFTIFKTSGIKHLQFSGGEPLARFNDLLALIREASPHMDCWLLTSGFGLTAQKAAALKKAGLTGANISLDHWDKLLHNNFRNNDDSFTQAISAIQHCIDAGIICSLSLCATREFVSEENLMKYATLAKEHNVHFIRILEPRAIGKFAGQQVHLEIQQIQLISEFAARLNSDSRYKDFPVVTFFGYYQREIGCLGAGDRYLYADPNGDVHACPFCRGKMGNLLEEPFQEIMDKLKSIGCRQFQKPT